MSVVSGNIVSLGRGCRSRYIVSSSSPHSEGEGELHSAATSFYFLLEDGQGVDIICNMLHHSRVLYNLGQCVVYPVARCYSNNYKYILCGQIRASEYLINC